jgi:hypothetical protein
MQVGPAQAHGRQNSIGIVAFEAIQQYAIIGFGDAQGPVTATSTACRALGTPTGARLHHSIQAAQQNISTGACDMEPSVSMVMQLAPVDLHTLDASLFHHRGVGLW